MVIYGSLFGGMHPVVFTSMMYMYIETFPVSVNTQHGNMVVYGSLYGGMHPLLTIHSASSHRQCMYIETFPVSVIAQHGNMVVYESSFGDMHPATYQS